jgi:hypothetical protein
LQAGETTEVEVARIERDQQAGLSDLGLRLAEAKQLTAALQAEIVPAQVTIAGEHHRTCAACGRRLAYLERNQGALVHYAARCRNGEPISTAFVESAVNEIITKRMNKKQQMRWNRATVQPFLDVRTAVLNDTLEDAFRRRYPGFRPANGDEVIALEP